LIKFAFVLIAISFHAHAQDCNPVETQKISAVMNEVAAFKAKFAAFKQKGLPRQKRCPQKCSTFKSFCEAGGDKDAQRLRPEAETLERSLASFGETQAGGCASAVQGAQSEIRQNRNELLFGEGRCQACAGQFNPPPDKPEGGC
jgi:hypothetical protein